VAERVTLPTIADALGVSRTTVSNAYNRPDQLAAELKIGYARVSTDGQDSRPSATRSRRLAASLSASTSTTASPAPTANRPGLRQALAACRAGDTLVVTKLDRLARSLPDARAIADELTSRQVKLALGTSVHDPTNPVGATAVQRARHGRRVRSRPDSRAHARGHARR
jgi:DNA invertase Pin-like site-specific DNA recombinase